MNKYTISYIIGCLLSSLALITAIAGQNVTDKRSTPMAPVDVQVIVRAVRIDQDVLKLDVVITNSGSSSVYITVDPQRADRSRGVYIEENSVDSSLLICSARLYPPPPFNMYFNEAHVRLLPLEPGQSRPEDINVTLPVRTTEPPFAARPGTRMLKGPFDRVQVVVGVLPQTDEINRLLAQKGDRKFVTGLETVGARPLYQIQYLVRSVPEIVSLGTR